MGGGGEGKGETGPWFGSAKGEKCSFAGKLVVEIYSGLEESLEFHHLE